MQKLIVIMMKLFIKTNDQVEECIGFVNNFIIGAVIIYTRAIMGDIFLLIIRHIVKVQVLLCKFNIAIIAIIIIIIVVVIIIVIVIIAVIITAVGIRIRSFNKKEMKEVVIIVVITNRGLFSLLFVKYIKFMQVIVNFILIKYIRINDEVIINK